MPIVFNCPNCSMHFSVGWEYLGQTGKCRGCGREMTVPFPAPDSPSLSPDGEADQDNLPKEWKVSHERVRHENLSIAAVIIGVRDGTFPDTALAWKEGMSGWKPIREIAEFRPAVAAMASRKSGKSGDT